MDFGRLVIHTNSILLPVKQKCRDTSFIFPCLSKISEMEVAVKQLAISHKLQFGNQKLIAELQTIANC